MGRDRWFSPAALATVVVGGAVGVAARAAIVVPLAAPVADGTPHPLLVPGLTLAINLFGSFLLGIVVAKAGEVHPRARLFWGTGVMGGFTTYSTFAVQAGAMASAAPLFGVGLIVLSLFGGVLAAAVGLSVGSRGSAPNRKSAETAEDAP